MRTLCVSLEDIIPGSPTFFFGNSLSEKTIILLTMMSNQQFQWTFLLMILGFQCNVHNYDIIYWCSLNIICTLTCASCYCIIEDLDIYKMYIKLLSGSTRDRNGERWDTNQDCSSFTKPPHCPESWPKLLSFHPGPQKSLQGMSRIRNDMNRGADSSLLCWRLHWCATKPPPTSNDKQFL